MDLLEFSWRPNWKQIQGSRLNTCSKTNNGTEEFFTDEKKANCLNNYFCSVSDKDDSDSQLPEFENKSQVIVSDIISESYYFNDISDIVFAGMYFSPRFGITIL